MTMSRRDDRSTAADTLAAGPGGRLLGVDLGSRRIGVAVADQVTGSVRALATLRRHEHEAERAALARLVAEHGVTELIVGLPLHMDGREGGQATEARRWAEQMATALDLTLTMRDERLSSVAAEGRMPRLRRASSGAPPSGERRDKHRARIDREAAAGILQAELDARAGLRS
ncbi:MAG: Holliday junction resolvase RuvX [Chloroflexi bacterium]|nr:Holliday junction resolvase RuvX [Chloroflexota bacterium]